MARSHKEAARKQRNSLPCHGEQKHCSMDGFLLDGIASVQLLVHIVEVRVLQGLLRRDPLRRLVLQHFLQQPQQVRMQSSQYHHFFSEHKQLKARYAAIA
uniref:Uncharacterized protein n=1 Tax=Arundo donax TaxID=35708 RepID=A0A0A9D1I7_ARUDO